MTPTGIPSKLSGGGLKLPDGRVMPWGAVPTPPGLESVLRNIVQGGWKNVKVSPPATREWIAESIRNLQADGKDVTGDIQLFKWYLYQNKEAIKAMFPNWIPRDEPILAEKTFMEPIREIQEDPPYTDGLPEEGVPLPMDPDESIPY
jgi:hypothetical protein